MNFDKCPRCLKDWNTFDTLKYRCKDCQIIFRTDPGEHPRWLRLNIAHNQYIFWYFENNNCIYSRYNNYYDFVKINEINLPWLSFNITEEQLQVYLAFS